MERERWKRLNWSALRSLWKKNPALAMRKLSNSIQELTTAVLKLGTLILILILVVWLLRSMGDEGYIIEPFSVPKALTESGFDGTVVARKIQDKVLDIKKVANTVKADSTLLQNSDSPELDVAVLGIGLSLKSARYHLRELLGRKNYRIYGEITHLNDTYTLTLRMTDYPPIIRTVVAENGNDVAAFNQLLRQGAEAILFNTDPYRLAVVCYREKRYEEGMHAIREIIETRPKEAHWAYLAWGSILEEQGNPEGAIAKYVKATTIQRDFDLAWVRMAWAYQRLNRPEEASTAMQEALRIHPHDVNRIINMAWMRHSQEMYEAADSLFEKASRLKPETPMVWSSWADSKFSRGDADAAVKLVERAEQYIGENAMGYVTRALSSITRHDTAATIQHLQTAFQLDPSQSLAASLLIRVHYASGDYQKAIAIGEQADWLNMNKENNNKQQALNILAMAYNMEGKHDQAMTTARHSIDVDRSMGYPYTTLAETFEFQGQRDSFYHYMNVAFAKGLDPKWITLTAPPYDRFAKDERFLEMLAVHARERKVKG